MAEYTTCVVPHDASYEDPLNVRAGNVVVFPGDLDIRNLHR